MFNTAISQDAPPGAVFRHNLSILLWIALSTGFAVSVFSVVEEMCLATACRDTASFTFFGVGMGWFGIAYFVAVLLLLWLRNVFYLLDWGLTAMVFSGIGAEGRLLWIQKYIILGWCPLCVTICFALAFAGLFLLIEKAQVIRSVQGSKKSFLGWVAFAVLMAAAGLTIAIIGVQALT